MGSHFSSISRFLGPWSVLRLWSNHLYDIQENKTCSIHKAIFFCLHLLFYLVMYLFQNCKPEFSWRFLLARLEFWRLGLKAGRWRLGIYGFIERMNGVFACLSILPLISFFTNCFLMFKHFFQIFFLSVVLSRLHRKNDRRNNIAYNQVKICKIQLTRKPTAKHPLVASEWRP